ncbi:MAG: pyridoxamine 5'-phosphate oxidase [Pedosphaera sp.]|nr:pyridoxamine 5'-phosphate oxidase [Pedosphaera sp.]
MNPAMSDVPKPFTEGLRRADLDPNPIRQFAAWFQRALNANLPEPNAMTLATATSAGLPSARIVLLKSYDDRGFTFFTNYLSPKACDLDENPRVALVLFWAVLERQVRITGTVSKVTREESDEYFHSRPMGSQVGAWASKQSEALPNREELERRFTGVEQRFKGQAIPLPDHWGGYRVVPGSVEFWQGRPSRLHDRFRYTKQTDGVWKLERLSP